MNKNDYKALFESDEILDSFITAILFYKSDALVYGNYGINNGTRPEMKEYYYYIAESWLKNYFDNFGDMNYETFSRIIKKRGTVRKTAPQVAHKRKD